MRGRGPTLPQPPALVRAQTLTPKDLTNPMRTPPAGAQAIAQSQESKGADRVETTAVMWSG